MDYRIEKVGEQWEFLPEKERNEKREYENLTIRINRREKKIESDLEKIKKLKEELREWKRKRTEGYNKMVKYHKKFLPKFSVTLDKGNKFVEYKSGSYVETSGNNQWGIWVSIGGKRRYVYVGTIRSVSYHLDLLENNVPHYNKNNSFRDGPEGYYERLKPTNDKGDEHKEIISSKIIQYIGDVLTKKMLGILKKDGNLDRFFDKKNYKIKGTVLLYDLYKKSPHYQPPQVERVRKKGGRLSPLKVGKNRVQ
jgi:hypothetical protein